MLPSVQNEERSHLGCMKVEKAKQQRDGRGWGVWNGSKYKWNWRQNNKENKWKACTSSFVENAWKAILARYLHSGLCKIFGRRWGWGGGSFIVHWMTYDRFCALCFYQNMKVSTKMVKFAVRYEWRASRYRYSLQACSDTWRKYKIWHAHFPFPIALAAPITSCSNHAKLLAPQIPSLYTSHAGSWLCPLQNTC